MEPIEILRENLKRNDVELTEAFEKSLPHLQMLGQMLSGLDEDEKREFLSRVNGVEPTPDGALSLFASRLRRRNEETMLFFADPDPDPSLPKPVLPEKKEVGIIYVRNSYSDAAFSAFAPLFGKTVVSYAASFVLACEEVYGSRADYCILPVESTRDGVLQSFRSMISKYELKTILTVRVPVGEETTTFALLAKTSEWIAFGGEQYCEVNVVIPPDRSIGECIGLIEDAGFRIESIRSVVTPYGNGTFDLLFRKQTGEIPRVLFLLNTLYPGAQLNGIYTLLNSEQR